MHRVVELLYAQAHRYHRLLGQDVFFMTGADEHGLLAQLWIPGFHLCRVFGLE